MLMPSLSVNGFANLSFFNYTDTHTGRHMHVACVYVCIKYLDRLKQSVTDGQSTKLTNIKPI